MFKYLNFTKWASNQFKRSNKISLKPGMLITFPYDIQKDDTELDFMPVFILVEAKFQYIYGVNILRLPKRFQDVVIPLLSNNHQENLKVAAEIRKNSIYRKAYKYYRMDNIKSKVIEINIDDLNRFN